MKYLLILPVRFYQIFISPLLGPRCRYTPTCSNYMIEAVEKHGLVKGGWLGTKRFCKCHPFAKTHWQKTNGFDPVPQMNKEQKKSNEQKPKS